MLHSKSLYEKGIIKDKKMITQSQFTQVKFMGKLENTKHFYNALKAINFNKNVNIILSETGLKAIVEEAKYVQAVAYVTRDFFSEFRLLQNEEISICVNLDVVCDCLSIFTGVESSMKMIYKGAGAPLVFVLEHHGEDELITECSVKTQNGEEPMDFQLDEENASYNSIILRGPDFSTLITEINKSADELEVFMSPKSPHFRLTTLGVMAAESNVVVARTSDMIIIFTCKNTTSAKYKMSHIRIPMKAMILASKVALRTDDTGILGMQMMITSEESAQIYIEYFITPLFDD